MSWFAELAGKAESLLTNLDEQTGAALRNHPVAKKKIDKNEIATSLQPELNRGPKRRLTTRNLKKPVASMPENKNLPCRKTSPIMSNHQPRLQSRDNSNIKMTKSRSPSRKSQCSLNNYQNSKKLSGDAKVNELDEYFGMKQRRNSLPADLEILNENENWLYKLQNMEVENTMLKNELNVLNRELAELLDRLRRTEDGNDVDSEELTKTKNMIDSNGKQSMGMMSEQVNITCQMEELKQKLQKLICTELESYRERNSKLQEDIDLLRSSNKDLEDKYREMCEKSTHRDAAHIKLESDLRYAQSANAGLQSDLERSRAECLRLERDWEAYKLRVKNMLHAKDNEIKSLHKGEEFTQDKQDLIEQTEKLREERDELTETTASVIRESEEMRLRLQQLEASHTSSERVVTALRDALLEERSARSRAEAQWNIATKELRSLQLETGQTIASLRTALRDKDNELNALRDSSATIRSADTSALNVADYDVMQDTIDNNKIQYLTQTLVQRQSTIDKLLADNNILRIQLEKLESKYKTEISSVRSNHTHSVIHLQDGDIRHRSKTYSRDVLSALSLWIGVMVKRYPIVRIFIIVYMVCLHLWVLTVLFTSTPEGITSRPSKS